MYAFTHDCTGGTCRVCGKSTADSQSTREFAKRGLKGLKSDKTVREYRNAWKKAIKEGNALHVAPGGTFKLPDMDWSDAVKKPKVKACDVNHTAPMCRVGRISHCR